MMRGPLALLLLMTASCTEPKPGTDRALYGGFTSGRVQGTSPDGQISLDGALRWHASVHGDRDGIVLRGALR